MTTGAARCCDGTHCVQGESRQRFAGEGSSGVGLKLIARKGGNQKKRA